MVGDCAKAIIEAKLRRRVRVLKWVDDFLILRLDPTVTIDDVVREMSETGFPWNHAKTVDFSSTPKYIGWIFNIRDRKAILPRDKAEKYLERARPFMLDERRSLTDSMQLLGSLQHVAYVARDLRPHLSALSAFVAGWEQNNPFQNRYVKPDVRAEAAKWVNELSHIPFVRSFAPPAKRFPDTVWVDASSEWGIGVMIGEKWSAWKWMKGWDADSRGIGWAEAVALEFGMLAALAYGAENCLIDFRSDNQGVLYSYKMGHSKGTQINTVMKRVVALERDKRMRLDISYVESANNPADGPSRGIFPEGPNLKVFPIPPLVSVYVKEVRRS
ncbi:hypothetical protein CF326_g9812 [Tilletia indica]|nr:hypothetical protein CF326_g9812 [Tilletia indica]